MTPEELQRIASLFHQARQRPPETRAAFLDKACAGDPSLLAEVESLLAEDTNPFPIGDVVHADVAGDLTDPDASASLPERIGRYRIIRIIASGGMGTVYEAMQDNPSRTVAVKVLRHGLLSRSARRRFEYESQVLARLRHPGIAQIYEAGTHNDGSGPLPYFAMEYVEGARPISRHAADCDLRIRDRLELFAKVCDAVEHGHQKGIIHRDLKPGNILVDSEGRVKIIDFGVARSTDSDLALTTMQTEAGQLIGTLQYMSPEQCGSDSAAIDTRSDVYALGVVLYELLCMKPPYDVTGIPVFEATRVIQQQEPSPPSSVDAALRGDVETIILKALEKNPQHRYQSARELAEDLIAVLEHRPIRARPSGPVTRTVKWARRNRGAAISIGTAAMVLIVVFASLGVNRAADRRAREREAARALADAKQLLDGYIDRSSSTNQLEGEFNQLRRKREGEYLTDEEDQRLDELEEMLSGLRRRRVEDSYDVLDLLARAGRLGADVRDVEQLRLRLYQFKYLEALKAGDSLAADVYLERQLGNDRAAAKSPRDEGSRMGFYSTPPGAHVYAFRFHDQSELFDEGEPRLVPVPLRESDLPVPPGTWTLRVVQGAGSIQTGDLVFEMAGHPIRNTVLVAKETGPIRRLDRLTSIDGSPVRGDYEVETLGAAAAPEEGGTPPVKRFEFERDGLTISVEGESLEQLGIVAVEPDMLGEMGDVPALVWSDGQAVSCVLPLGLKLRTTARPLFIGGGAYLGRTPMQSRLKGGRILLLIRAEGYEDHRLVVQAAEYHHYHVRLIRDGTSPDGFVYVPDHEESRFGSFRFRGRQVTAGEYLEFLNDPSTLSAIDRAMRPFRYPRDSNEARATGYWKRDSQGRFALPGDWPHQRPIDAVSWSDASAYCVWRSELDGLRPTVREYFEFLNDPWTINEIAVKREACLLPRDLGDGDAADCCERDEQGRFVIPGDWAEEQSIFGVSSGDLNNYAGWSTEHDRTSPYSFEFIPHAGSKQDEPGSFWIMEHEVTVDEYLEFLNEPKTLEEIAASTPSIRFPRTTFDWKHPGKLEWDEKNGFTIPDYMSLDWPIYGISWVDANAYARWKTERARAAGLDYTFTLPTLAEWEAADGRIGFFSFGNHYRPKWVSSCFAHLKPHPEPVMRFPIDESALGVYDMAGSVSEWLDEPWLEDRWFNGGSWGDGIEDMFKVRGGGGAPPTQTGNTIGFRLALRMNGERSLDSSRLPPPP